jgi:hypothetical protein
MPSSLLNARWHLVDLNCNGCAVEPPTMPVNEVRFFDRRRVRAWADWPRLTQTGTGKGSQMYLESILSRTFCFTQWRGPRCAVSAIRTRQIRAAWRPSLPCVCISLPCVCIRARAPLGCDLPNIQEQVIFESKMLPRRENRRRLSEEGGPGRLSSTHAVGR